MRPVACGFALLAGLVSSPLRADELSGLFDQGKLLATGGVSQVEGSGGGGLANWALITGYGTRDGVGANAHYTTVLLPDYRLAPDHAYPAQLDDALAVYRALLDSGVAPGRLAVAGDSAGGNLALALVLRARELGLALPAALVCYSPWTDLTHAGASIRANAELDQAIPVKMLGPLAAMYCGGRDPRDPLISPLFAGHHRFPPTQLHVAADEVLRDDTLRLVRQLTASGVEVEHRIWADVPHAFPVFAATLAQGRAAIRDSGEFLLRHFESAA